MHAARRMQGGVYRFVLEVFRVRVGGHLAVKQADVGDDRPPARERPRLVKHDGADAVRALQRVRPLTRIQQDRVSCSFALRQDFPLQVFLTCA